MISAMLKAGGAGRGGEVFGVAADVGHVGGSAEMLGMRKELDELERGSFHILFFFYCSVLFSVGACCFAAQ